jgi:hypothetical protein
MVCLCCWDYPCYVGAVGTTFRNRCMLHNFMHIYMQWLELYIPFSKNEELLENVGFSKHRNMKNKELECICYWNPT